MNYYTERTFSTIAASSSYLGTIFSILSLLKKYQFFGLRDEEKSIWISITDQIVKPFTFVSHKTWNGNIWN